MTKQKKQSKPSKRHISKILKETEDLDPKWESKRDYVLYVRQLERLSAEPKYIV